MRKNEDYFVICFSKVSELLIVTMIDLTVEMTDFQNHLDSIYQTALHSNFSHEQMTPLNNIQSNTRILLKRLKQGLLGDSNGLCSIIEGLNCSCDILVMNN